MGWLILIAIFFGVGAALAFGGWILQLIFWGFVIIGVLSLIVYGLDALGDEYRLWFPKKEKKESVSPSEVNGIDWPGVQKAIIFVSIMIGILFLLNAMGI